MCWDFNKRKYETEYTFANKLGRFIGRKMLRESMQSVSIPVHRNSYYREWLTGHMYMMHSAHKCFDKELYYGWESTQHRPNYDGVEHDLLRINMGECIVFINMYGLLPERRRVIQHLKQQAMNLAPSQLFEY